MRISDWSSDVCSSDLKGQQDRSDRHMVFPPADDFLFCLIACCGHGGAPCIGGHALPGFLSRQFLRRAACFLLLCLSGRFALYVRAGEVDARLTQERGDLAMGYGHAELSAIAVGERDREDGG